MNFRGTISVDMGEVTELFERIKKAEEEIYECYNRLRSIGVVTFSKELPEEPAARL